MVDLAKEFGVKSVEVLELATELDIPVRRVAAMLTTAQAEKLREAANDGRLRSHKAVRTKSSSARSVANNKWETSRCGCCKLPFKHATDHPKTLCDRCSDHYEKETETTDETIDRYKSHDEILREWQGTAAAGARNYHQRMKSALASRDKWRRLLIEVAIAHEQIGDGCCCGAKAYPCLTRRQIEYSNLGIARYIEQIESLPDGEIRRFLHGDDDLLDEWD